MSAGESVNNLMENTPVQRAGTFEGNCNLARYFIILTKLNLG